MRVTDILSLLFSLTRTNETEVFDQISTYSLHLHFKLCDMFSYIFHLARDTGHEKDIVNDCKKKKAAPCVFSKAHVVDGIIG